MRRHLKSHAQDESAAVDLLKAARVVFARHGFEGTTVRLIAENAGTSPGVINYHFGSKEGLWQAVCEESALELAGVLKDSADFSLPPKEFVGHLAGALFDAMKDHRDLLRIVVWATLEAETMDYQKVRGALAPLITFGEPYWKKHQESGALKAEDMALALMHLRAVLLMSVVDQPGHRHNFGKDLNDPEHAARVRTSLVRAAEALLGAA